GVRSWRIGVAAALAQVAGDALLVDLDPWVWHRPTAGCENAPGLRWPISRCRAARSTGRRCARRCRGTAA
ncbi:hypothetical protein I553_3770, partial [Mycobacterium xenopi 4042]